MKQKKPRWKLLEHPNGLVVLPIDDLKEHDEASIKCWCNPHVENTPCDHSPPHYTPTLVHHSADKREIDELVERIFMDWLLS